MDLDNVMHERQKFSISVENVQKIVDELSTAGFPELSTWVERVNKKMRNILVSWLKEALYAWSETLLSSESNAKKNSKTRRYLIRIPNKLHDYMGILCALPCLNSGRFDAFEKKSNVGETVESFFDLVNSVSPEALSNANYSVEAHIQSLFQFVNQWLAYQTL